MQEMMKQCCGADGTPDPEKMKQFFGRIRKFMDKFSKQEFVDEDFVEMQEFCEQLGMPESGGRMIKMLQMRESMKSAWSESKESATAE